MATGFTGAYFSFRLIARPRLLQFNENPVPVALWTPVIPDSEGAPCYIWGLYLGEMLQVGRLRRGLSVDNIDLLAI